MLWGRAVRLAKLFKVNSLHRRKLVLPVRSETPDIILQEHDLLPTNDLYITKMSKEDFDDKFGEKILIVRGYEGGPLRRLGIVLPFINNKKVKNIVPIPFIIDTGSPTPIYLGEAAFDFFEDNDLILDVHSRDVTMVLNGSFVTMESELNMPKVERTPRNILHKSIRQDPRCNLLGLPGILELGILKMEEKYCVYEV